MDRKLDESERENWKDGVEIKTCISSRKQGMTQLALQTLSSSTMPG